jgi:hypothetical protein
MAMGQVKSIGDDWRLRGFEIYGKIVTALHAKVVEF